MLYDIGAVTTKEPFQRLVSQGMILGEVSTHCWLICKMSRLLSHTCCCRAGMGRCALPWDLLSESRDDPAGFVLMLMLCTIR